MHPKPIALLLLVASTTATLPSTAMATEPPARRPPSDVGIGVGQVALGTGVVVASTVIASQVALSGTDDYALLAGGLALGAAATGLTVCAIGLSSTKSEGGCPGAMVGSGVGALAAFPVAMMASGALEGSVLGFVGGYVIGTVAGATIGWHVGKRPRAATPPTLTAPPAAPAALAPPAEAWPELRRRTWAGAGARDGLKLTVPIVALTF